jgi:hypothetical protein
VSGKRDLNPDGALRISNRVADFHSQLPVLTTYRSAPVHSFPPHSGQFRAGRGQQVGNSSARMRGAVSIAALSLRSRSGLLHVPDPPRATGCVDMEFNDRPLSSVLEGPGHPERGLSQLLLVMVGEAEPEEPQVAPRSRAFRRP